MTEQIINKKPERLFFIDNLRVLLIILVVTAHVSLTYGSPEGANAWYYYEPNKLLSTYLLTIFTAILASFIMGFFFMISGYFTPGSYNHKGPKAFLLDRLLRLGIPLVFYIFVIGPFLKYISLFKSGAYKLSFWHFYATDILHFKIFDVGPLWFIEVLLIFTLIYYFYRLMTRKFSAVSQKENKTPGNIAIIVFILVLALFSFLVRLYYPLGKELLGVEIGYMPQYALMYAVGIIAYYNNWFIKLPNSMGKLWLIIAAITILLWPVLILCGGALKGYDVFFVGGLHWQAFAYALWESFDCLAIVIGLSVLFRNKLNYQGKLAKIMSKNAYTVFIIHPLVIVFLSYSIIKIAIHPMLKFVLVSFVGVALCFLVSQYIIRKIPFLRRIL